MRSEVSSIKDDMGRAVRKDRRRQDNIVEETPFRRKEGEITNSIPFDSTFG